MLSQLGVLWLCQAELYELSGSTDIRGLPCFDLGPGSFVDCVVYGDHCLHVGNTRRVVTFALHGLEEHFFGWVNPVATLFIGSRLDLVVDGAAGRAGR